MTTTKVQIKTTCDYCNGKAYIPLRKTKSYCGEIYTRYLPCNYCEGTGLLPKWISLVEFIIMIDAIDPMQPDYEALSQHEPTSQYQDSRDSAGI